MASVFLLTHYQFPVKLGEVGPVFEIFQAGLGSPAVPNLLPQALRAALPGSPIVAIIVSKD